MGIFNRKKKNVSSQPGDEKAVSTTPAAPPPPTKSILNGPYPVYFTTRHPWKWILQRVAEENEFLKELETPADLPTGKMMAEQQANGTGTTPPTRGKRRRKVNDKDTLRVEIPLTISTENGEITNLEAVHGTSEAFDGLEDKDELVRTLQRCRCEHLELSPPSRLINWDATKEECKNLVGDELPRLLRNDKTIENRIAVLKEPMGSGGQGIFFVKNAEDIGDIIESHRKQANDNTEVLDNLIAQKGRIPSWVLQAEVFPGLLIKGRRKFHIRTYVLALENLYGEETEDILDVKIFTRHEVRIAATAVPEDEDPSSRERTAHITNGAVSEATERELLHEVPELVERNLQSKLEMFVAQIFGKHFYQDMARRVSMSANQDDGTPLENVKKFVLAGLDIMVTDDDTLYLLEVNVNPFAPALETVSEGFQAHLVGFMKELMDVVVGNPSSNFVSCKTVLERK